MKYITTGLVAIAAMSFAFDLKPHERDREASGATPPRMLSPWEWKWEKKTASLDGEVYKEIMLSRYRLSLRDPESAKFRNVVVNLDGSISGLVNAKNGFGGMSGWTEFRYGA
jgi:hypothetical protein